LLPKTWTWGAPEKSFPTGTIWINHPMIILFLYFQLFATFPWSERDWERESESQLGLVPHEGISFGCWV
jgi:hypothetical protein